MKRSLRFLAAFCLLGSVHSTAAELRVSAAASLSEAMTEISELYQKTNGDKLQLNFGGSNALARQIKAGAPCDVFFSADEASLASLIAENLIHENSVTKLLGNSLVIIVPTDSTFKITSAEDLTAPTLRHLALGDPAAVPAGVYARKWLESKQVWEALSGRIVAMENVRGALAAVETGNAQASIVYKTDAMITTKAKVSFQIPAAETPGIIYPVAATKSSPDPGRAIRFITFLQSEAAANIFTRRGFIPLPAAVEK